MIWQHYAIAALIGFLVGTSELIARYRDAPKKAIFTLPAIFYVLINATASMVALYLIDIFNWMPPQAGESGGESQDAANAAMRILLAGFGAMAFFRSSFFYVRMGTNDVSVGPNGLLQIFLDATDRAVDRERAKPRAIIVKRIMEGVSFDEVKLSLPAFCFALMQGVSQDEQNEFAKILQTLDSSEMDDYTKSLNLGLILMNIVGEHVLREAVSAMHAEGQETN